MASASQATMVLSFDPYSALYLCRLCNCLWGITSFSFLIGAIYNIAIFFDLDEANKKKELSRPATAIACIILSLGACWNSEKLRKEGWGLMENKDKYLRAISSKIIF